MIVNSDSNQKENYLNDQVAGLRLNLKGLIKMLGSKVKGNQDWSYYKDNNYNQPGYIDRSKDRDRYGDRKREIDKK